jgi:hypothetical protein
MADRGASSVLLNPLHWLPEFWQLGRQRLMPQARLLGLSLLVGVIAGLGAVLFYLATRTVFHVVLEMIVGYHPGGPTNEPPLDLLLPPSHTPFHWWMLLFIPALGGLVSGFLVYTFAPEAEGHGTDSAIAAYHFTGGVIRPRVPLVKIVASAITLGTGGSGGREGPIAQIGAGFGSWLGGLLFLRPAERRLLLAAGMGAGIAAIFRAPLAGALFAAEVMYRSPDFESEVVIPAALACIVAYCTFGVVFSHWTGPPQIQMSLPNIGGTQNAEPTPAQQASIKAHTATMATRLRPGSSSPHAAKAQGYSTAAADSMAKGDYRMASVQHTMAQMYHTKAGQSEAAAAHEHAAEQSILAHAGVKNQLLANQQLTVNALSKRSKILGILAHREFMQKGHNPSAG